MHTCEHIVNRTMDRLHHCGRAVSAHIERKKSKLDYALPAALTDDQIRQLEETVNEVIDRLQTAATFELWGPRGETKSAVRFVTDWATSEADVNALVDLL